MRFTFIRCLGRLGGFGLVYLDQIIEYPSHLMRPYLLGIKNEN
jgi:hypothetical protein